MHKLKLNQFFSRSMIEAFFVALVFKTVVFFVLFTIFQINPLVFTRTNIVKIRSIVNLTEVAQANVPRKTLPPKYVRGIYLTAYSASRTEWIDRLIKRMVDGGVINSVVIDIKDYSGYVLYNSDISMVKALELSNPIAGDIQGVVKKFHDAGIYVIARQTVFQDPALTKVRPDLAVKKKDGSTWYNYGGLAFSNPQNREVWEYNIEIAKEAARLGFDEINFDYIRYPSDGNINNIDYNLPEGKTKVDMIEEFFVYLSGELTPIVNISADLFGMVMDNVDSDYDIGIGQRLDSTVDYFDFVCPMMYASHYPYKYLGRENPASYPGLVMDYGIKKANHIFIGKRATLRPWLQAFNMGAIYDEVRINEEVIATEKTASTTGWLLWNARNYYEDHVFY